MTTIDSDKIGLFLKTNFNTNKLSLDNAKDLGMRIDYFNEADTDKDGVLTSDEIEDCDNVQEFLASVILEEPDKKNVKDEEAEKEELERVDEKNDTGLD